MLKDLVKVANRLDSLGLSKEADFLDSIIRKIAAMNTGTPPYMNAGTGDFELEMGEDGNWDYPVNKTIIPSNYESPEPQRKFEDACRKLHSAINNWYLAVEKTLNFEQNKNIFNFIPKINKIKRTLVDQYSDSGLNTRRDVLNSINNLLETIQKHNQDRSLPASDLQLEWWFAPEELYHISSHVSPKLSQFDHLYDSVNSRKAKDEIKYMVKYLRMGSKRINNALDALEDLSTENAYTEMDEIREIIDPAMELASSLKEISDPLIREVFQAVRELSFVKDDSRSYPVGSEYLLPPVPRGSTHPDGWSRIQDTSPAQARFEESQILMGDMMDMDIVDPDELDFYMNPNDYDGDDDYDDDDDDDDDRKK
jgi:hypothetical protein